MRIKYEAIDLFSGCGGVSCGLSLAGFRIKSAVEIEKNAVNTYLNYAPLKNVNVLNKDICELTGEQILKAAKLKLDDIYLFAGCPPCQNFTRKNPSNKKKSEDERKKLLFQFLRIIEKIEPPFILMENVPGIVSDFNSNILREFLERLNSNYDVFKKILNAADYGVPQTRKRFVMHAVRRDINQELKNYGFQFDLPKPTHNKSGTEGLRKWKTVREAIGDLPEIKAGAFYIDDGKVHNHKCSSLSETNLKRIEMIRQNGGSRNGLPQELVLECHKKADSKGDIFLGHGDAYGIMDPDKPAPTITGGCLYCSKGRYGHYNQNRAISIREAARLQTFPDDFIFSDSLTNSALQIGNAVPIELVKSSGFVFKQAIRVLEINRRRTIVKYNE
ncbi:DNA cytosine methyltransferase [bacterium C-53]|nr:DNA cytosine methyltransferase [Lachnospiraceae bacterium]NBI02817.1 DNA cytosine methyltransferase [Lachnospiraceae bacterium]RKJ10946.1 DNA cytosine methyltransferase [bacterium C-53]